MTDNETIKAGDELMCISNEGCSSMGDIVLIYGLTIKSINTSGSHTGWQSRDSFRWRNYMHYPCKDVPESVLKFQEKQKEVDINNASLRKQVAKRISS